MKITSASIAIIAVLASHVDDVLALNGRTLKSSDDEIEVNVGQSKPFGTSKKEDNVAIITNLYLKCYYQFHDEDDYRLIKDSESAMTCANNICNLDFLGNEEGSGLYSATNRIVGLNMKLDPFRSQTDQIIGEFRVGCAGSDHWNAAFACPAGYYVKELQMNQRSKCGGTTGKECAKQKVCDKQPVFLGNNNNPIDRRVCTEFIDDPTDGITLGAVDGSANNPKVDAVEGQSVLYVLKCRELPT